MFRRTMRAVTFSGILLMCNCTTEKQPEKPQQDTGREETKKAEALNAIGMPGSAIRERIDHGLDQQDERQKQLEEAQQLNK